MSAATDLPDPGVDGDPDAAPTDALRTSPEAQRDEAQLAVEAVASAATAPRPHRLPWWPSVVPALIALVTRAVRLGHPPFMVFDEVFYAPDALDTLQWGAERGRAVHPPLGKLLIAAGVRIAGFTPTGWRLTALVAGAAVVGLTAAVVHRLSGRPRLACWVGLLAAFDGVLFTTGRLAMLDVFVALFVMAATWFLAVLWVAPADAHGVRRWAAVGAVVCASLGGSVKWSSVWILPVVAAVVVVVEWRHHVRGKARRRVLAARVAVLVLVPLPLYLLTWVPRELGPARLSPAGFVRQQHEVAEFHLGLRPTNPNASPAGRWLWLDDPVRLFSETCLPAMSGQPTGMCPRHPKGTTEVRVLALANPVVWVIGLAGLVGSLWVVLRRRRGAALWVLVLAATQWVPWIVNPRAAYTFYQASLIPLMLVAVGVALSHTSRTLWRYVGLASLVASAAAFVFFYPLWAGTPLSPSAYELRTWLPSWG